MSDRQRRVRAGASSPATGRSLLDDPARRGSSRRARSYVFAVPTAPARRPVAASTSCQVAPARHVRRWTLGAADGRRSWPSAARDTARRPAADGGRTERLVDGWVRALSSALADPRPATPSSSRRSPVETVDGAAYRLTRALRGPGRRGRWSSHGDRRPRRRRRAGPFPLSSATWLRTTGPGRLVPADGRRSPDAVPSALARSTGSSGASAPGVDALGAARARPVAGPLGSRRGQPRPRPARAAGLLRGRRTGAERRRRSRGGRRSAARRLPGGRARRSASTVEAPPAWQAGSRDRLGGHRPRVARADAAGHARRRLVARRERAAAGVPRRHRRAGRPAARRRPRAYRARRPDDRAAGSRVTADVAASLSRRRLHDVPAVPGPPARRRATCCGSGCAAAARHVDDRGRWACSAACWPWSSRSRPGCSSTVHPGRRPRRRRAGGRGDVRQRARDHRLPADPRRSPWPGWAPGWTSRSRRRSGIACSTCPAPFFRQYSSGDLALRATSISAMRRVLSGVVTTAVLGAGLLVVQLRPAVRLRRRPGARGEFAAARAALGIGSSRSASRCATAGGPTRSSGARSVWCSRCSTGSPSCASPAPSRGRSRSGPASSPAHRARRAELGGVQINVVYARAAAAGAGGHLPPRGQRRDNLDGRDVPRLQHRARPR